MTSKYTIQINDEKVFMYSNLKAYKQGVIESQFKDIAIWIPTLNKYMNSMNKDLIIKMTSSVSPLSRAEIPEEYFYRYTSKIERILIQFGTDTDGNKTIVVNPIFRTANNIPWFMINEMGNVCTCMYIGQPDYECKIHHMSIEGHHLMCGCNGEPDWGLPKQFPLIDVLPNFVPRHGQRPNNKTIKRITKFKIKEYEAKLPNKK